MAATDGLDKAACLEKANDWLSKGIKAEADGKEPTHIDRYLKVAVDYENAAFDGRS